jgi:hypothetical protein
MRRRRLLAALGVTLSGGLAGCEESAPRARQRPTTSATRVTESATPTATATETETRTPPADPDLPVPRSELERSVARDAIPAITDPAFGRDWSDIEVEFEHVETGETSIYRPSLAPEDEVIGVDREGQARAYPLKVLRFHEVVNDSLGGPLLVTYCPLCSSGIVAERVVDGEPTVFGVSGLLWHSNLVLYDRATESLWSQIRARAIRGPMVGTDLAVRPSRLTTWETWRQAHPDSEVLLPSPRSETVHGPVRINYSVDLYSRQVELAEQGYSPDRESADGRLPPYTEVVGVSHDGQATAYAEFVVDLHEPVNDSVGDLPVLVATLADRSFVVYDRRVDGRELTFEDADDDFARAGGSRWNITTGRAVDGPHAGQRLDPVESATRMFYFAWLDFHPETAVFGRDE